MYLKSKGPLKFLCTVIKRLTILVIFCYTVIVLCAQITVWHYGKPLEEIPIYLASINCRKNFVKELLPKIIKLYHNQKKNRKMFSHSSTTPYRVSPEACGKNCSQEGAGHRPYRIIDKVKYNKIIRINGSNKIMICDALQEKITYARKCNFAVE